MEATLGRWAQREGALRHLDPTLIVSAVALSVFGLFMVYSATNQSLASLGEDPGFYLKKQIAFLMLGVIAMIFAATFDYRLVKVYAPIAYGAVLLTLLLVLTPFGQETAGAQRWITFFGFQFQPAELAKLVVVAALAAYLSELREVRLEEDQDHRAPGDERRPPHVLQSDLSKLGQVRGQGRNHDQLG
ncbi:MAG TPA: FtsW/RodA/SpoVE family cell cycle protein, partial [Actinomycetota bacterium]|nr:FtsW/RodA/SpoVE family cell cycle protein [Actinomycetota bacterium]